MVGSAMAVDLAKNHNVTLTDINKNVLDKVYRKNNDLKIKQLDASNKAELQSTIKDYDLVISAVPGFMGFETLRSVIDAEMNVVDIAFFPENSLELDALAKELWRDPLSQPVLRVPISPAEYTLSGVR